MEPEITCLDEVSWQHDDFTDDDISVGTVVSVHNEECWPDQTFGVAHRVIDKVIRQGVVHYRLQGDNNPGFDDCWHTLANIELISVEIHKNARPWNAPLRDKVNEVQSNFYQLRSRYCAWNSSQNAWGCWDNLEEVQAASWQSWCWTEAASRARYRYREAPLEPTEMPGECHIGRWTWDIGTNE